MVQYIFTPWRNRGELLAVRRQFYPDRHPQQQPSRRQTAGQGQAQHQSSPSSTNAGAAAHSTYRRAAAVNGFPPSPSLAAAQEQAGGRRHAEQQEAVARVSMWMQRGGCPHMVESTALLTAAILSDEAKGAGTGPGPGTGSDDDGLAKSSRAYAVRAAYSAAFSRFVTGLLDSHQDRQRKMSMYDVAKSVGLPATFVELRHQATHEQLPSLPRLRAAADRALDWIWDYYWRGLGPAAGGDDDDERESGADEDRVCRDGRETTAGEAMEGVLGEGDGGADGPDVTMRGAGGGGGGDGLKPAREQEVRALLERHLLGKERQPQEAEEGEEEERLKRELQRFDEGLVLMVLDSISDNTRDSKVLRRALVLGRRILEWKQDQEDVRGADLMEEDGPAGDELSMAVMDATAKKATEGGDDKEKVEGEEEDEVEEEDEPVEDGPGWVLYDAETWIPKPIGVV
ncbi:hypothetical protein VTH06DRAFT_1349 [Thermothelomyces fergusii]